MVVLAVVLRFALPSVPAERASSLRLLVDTLRRPGIGLGMVGHVLVVLGHFLAYTYVRLALERIPEVDPSTIVVLLALFGVGGLLGNIIAPGGSKTLGTILGAAGGAAIGNSVDRDQVRCR